jgi:hypothetical protein
LLVDLIYLAHPVAPPPGSTETVDSNLDDAESDLVALQRANPDMAIVAPWIQELRLRIGVDFDPESRRRGLARCRATAARCDGIVLCGPRISSGMLGELTAYRTERPAPWTIHRFLRRDQSLNLGMARTQARMHEDLVALWLRWTWFGAFPQSAELVAQEILDAERRYREVRT